VAVSSPREPRAALIVHDRAKAKPLLKSVLERDGFRVYELDGLPLRQDAEAMLRSVLERDGFGVAEGSPARELLEHARGFDLVLLDLQMPKMEGRAVATRLRREPGGPRVVLVAATPEPVSIPGVEVVRDPVRRGELRRAVLRLFAEPDDEEDASVPTPWPDRAADEREYEELAQQRRRAQALLATAATQGAPENAEAIRKRIDDLDRRLRALVLLDRLAE
jgi:CheY-like chemotaxis protein